VLGTIINVYSSVESLAEQNGKQIKFIFGSSAIKKAVTAYEWLAIVCVILFVVRSFLRLFIHS